MRAEADFEGREQLHIPADDRLAFGEIPYQRIIGKVKPISVCACPRPQRQLFAQFCIVRKLILQPPTAHKLLGCHTASFRFGAPPFFPHLLLPLRAKARAYYPYC